jgi:hypothetical protein
MAARFAAASGNWSGAIWAATIDGAAGSAAVPTSADDVTIVGPRTACTINTTTDVITAVGSNLTNGEAITLTYTSAPTPLSANILYYVRDATADTFKVSTSPGAAAVNITAAGSGVFFSRYDPAYKVILDSTACACNTLTISSHGILSGITTGNHALAVQLGGAILPSGLIDIDMRTSAYVSTLILNNSGNATAQSFLISAGGHMRLRGKTKKAFTRINGGIAAAATSVAVDDAGDWEVGDTIVLAPTETNFNSGNGWIPRYDRVVLDAAYTPGSGNLSWAAGATYSHADNAHAANVTRNVIVTTPGAGGKAFIRYGSGGVFAAIAPEISYTKFADLGIDPLSPNASFLIQAPSPVVPWNAFTGNVFEDASHSHYSPVQGLFIETWSVYTRTGSTKPTGRGGTNYLSPSDGIEDCCFIGSLLGGGFAKMSTSRRVVLCGASWSSVSTAFGAGGDATNSYNDFEFYCNQMDIDGSYAAMPDAMFINPVFQQLAQSYRMFHSGYAQRYRLVNPQMAGIGTLTPSIMTIWSKLVFENKNGNIDLQEVYTSESVAVPTVQRDTVEKKNADGSIKLFGSTYGVVDRDVVFAVLVAVGATLTLRGSCKVDANFYNSGDWYAPTLRFHVDGAEVTSGVTNYTATTSASAGWETFVATMTNGAASAKVVTVKLRADRKGVSGFCWFSGIPVYPYVRAVRHYGYIFDETNPVRVVNPTVSASEATAAAYTSIAVTWGAASSSVSITENCTLQKLYDYTQAQGCLNVGSAMPLTGAGAAGAPALFAAGDITVTDAVVLNGGGSLSMGSKVLITEFASGSNYTYTGGTWSQLSTVPTFNGGTLTLGVEDTFVFSATAATVTCAPSADAVTYEMGGCTFSGAMVFRNTHATRGITVKVPAGTDYTTTTAGGSITVTVASAALTIAANVSLVGSEVRIYDLDSTGNNLGAELTGVESCPTATYAYSGAAGNVVWVQILKSGYVEFGQQIILPATSSTFTATLRPDKNA